MGYWDIELHLGALVLSIGIMLTAHFITSYFYRIYRYKLSVIAHEKRRKTGRNVNIQCKLTSNPFHIEFQDLNLRVGKFPVLNGVSGEFKPGRLTAIMGPSGSGKSSMLNVLSGRAGYGETSGKVYLNGKKCDIRLYKRVMGFVPQEDIMIREATVEEILIHSAETRLPRDCSIDAREKLVEEILEMLDLAKIRYSQIGDENVRGISGGERKRVNIAMELVSNPCVLFLDEPTSGLDASSSSSVCNILKTLAHNAGLTIVAVIHQPRYEIFSMFDDVALLGVGGKPVYIGPRADVSEYFSKMGFKCPKLINPADYYLDVISGQYKSETLISLYYKHMPSGDTQEIIHTIYAEKQGQDAVVSINNYVALEQDSEQESDEEVVGYDGGNLRISRGLETEGGRRTQSAYLRRRLMPTTCDMLQQQWEVYENDVEMRSFSSSPEMNGTMTKANYGTNYEFTFFFTLSLIIPWVISLFYSPTWHITSLKSHYGAVLGSMVLPSITLVVLGILDFAYFPASFAFSLLGLVLFLMFAFSVIFLYDVVHADNIDSPNHYFEMLSAVWTGYIMGPLYPFILYVFPDIGRKNSSGLLAGTMLFFMELGFWAFLCDLFTEPFIYLIVGALECALLAKFVTFIYRFNNLTYDERATLPFFNQVYMFAKREVTMILRNWKALTFHFTQLIFGGLFIGIFYYGRRYKGPLFSVIGELQGSATVCPKELESSLLNPFCLFLQYPQDDPLIPTASLNVLVISLSAVSYAIPVFGKDVRVFVRESGAGISTAAFFLGKQLAQLPVILLAPALYLLAFSAMFPLEAPWRWHYASLLLTYLTYSGLGYIISLSVPALVAQLVGVFICLTNMMFSGANPTLLQLKNNALFGEILFYPTYICYSRWAIELSYLMEIQFLTSQLGTMELFYNYTLSDWETCWAVLGFSAFMVRVVTYLLLVLKEE